MSVHHKKNVNVNFFSKKCGISHGIAGNGYSFLYLYATTKDVAFLEMAADFCAFCWSETGKSILNVPDNPYSLFEGIAGTVLYFVDVLNYEKCSPQFPAFDL
jgi:hypothetical protein